MSPGRNALLSMAEAATHRGMVKAHPDTAHRAGRRLLRLLLDAEGQGHACLMRTAGGRYRTTLGAVESAIGLVGQECVRDRRVDDVAAHVARDADEREAAIRGVIEAGHAIAKLGEVAAQHERRLSRLEGAVFGHRAPQDAACQGRPRQYSPARREAALALVAAGTPIRAVARQLRIGEPSVRRWLAQGVRHDADDCSQEREIAGEESTRGAAVA